MSRESSVEAREKGCRGRPFKGGVQNLVERTGKPKMKLGKKLGL